MAAAAQVENRLVGAGNLLISEFDCVLSYKRIKRVFSNQDLSLHFIHLKRYVMTQMFGVMDDNNSLSFCVILNVEKKCSAACRRHKKKRKTDVLKNLRKNKTADFSD